MRIGVNCFTLQAKMGGVKQYFLMLFNWLLEYDFANDYVFFYSEHNSTELAKLRSRRWRLNAKLLSGQKQIEDYFGDIDVYFCPFNSLWPRPTSIASVVTLVDIQEVFFPQFFSRQERYDRAYHYPASTRAADRVVTISEFSKTSIMKHHRVSGAKIIVAHLSADPAYFNAPKIATALDSPIPFDDFIFFPANLWRHKNHETLLRALRLLKDRGEHVNLVVTGFEMPEGYPLHRKALEYGVADRVHTAGYVTVGQMAYLYGSAKMTVFPSLFEGFGLPPLEAMAVGCPVVVASGTSLPEVCGDAAEYFEPTDSAALAEAISRVRKDHKLRAALVDKGRIRARLFSAEAMARAHLRAFDEASNSYSMLHAQWHKLVYQPYHKWRVDSFNDLKPSQAISLIVSWTSKTLATWKHLLLDLCALPERRLRLRGFATEIQLIKSSGLFHDEFYACQVKVSVGLSKLEHYLLYGAGAALDPHPLFKGLWYLQTHQDVAAAGYNPLVHFLLFGAKENRDPHPLFDVSWYLWKNPDVAATEINPLEHFLLFGAKEHRDPHPLFNVSWYLRKNPDVAAVGMNPLEHYVRWGAPEGRNPHPLFQAEFYLGAIHEDHDVARENPLIHYLSQEPFRAANPHPLFENAWYQQKYPDVAMAKINSLLHYLTDGSFDPAHPYSALQHERVSRTDNAPRNILFVLYDDFRCNSAIHVHSLARELFLLGFSCAVAIPSGKDTADQFPGRKFEPVLYEEVEQARFCFPDGRGPDIVHAWTPREIVRNFCLRIAELYRFRQFVHMEQNERQILALLTCRPWSQIERLTLGELDGLVPMSLFHPVRGVDFMRNSDGITLVIDKLKELVPSPPSSLVLWPSAQPDLFFPCSRSKANRDAFGISAENTVIVYTGNVHQANAQEVHRLYVAIAMLNREGFPTTLVRTGENYYPLLGSNESWIKPFVLELGTVPRESIPSVMALADLFVQPGRPDEFNNYRFPSKLPEFLSIGRPIILPASNIALHMVHGKDAWILQDANEINIAEAVRTIMGDWDLYTTLASGALDFFRTRLDCKRDARELAEFYFGGSTLPASFSQNSPEQRHHPINGLNKACGC